MTKAILTGGCGLFNPMLFEVLTNETFSLCLKDFRFRSMTRFFFT